ncbi:MAG: efflux RND transporter periplasmic adaptor subunit [Phaeodactylibacter sp.]|nr:efflux RND transporter periplasmic adaptor subunit [Phaeodactylibacter sp.]
MNKVILALGLILFAMSSCDQEHEKVEETPKLEVSNPIRKDTTICTEYVCQIHASRHIELRALERGYLQSIFVDEGQSIKKGQPMFKIMPNVYEADLQKAKAEAEVARIEYQNTKMLADKNIVSQNELALAKANLDKAEAEVALAQTHLGFTNINAPFSGIMDHLHVREGSLLEEGELLTTLSGNNEMWVYFNVPEAEYLDYVSSKQDNKQKKVRLEMANGKVFPQEGTIQVIEGEFDNETGNIAFRASFPNPDGMLRHGETGNILMYIPYKDALIIPQKATFEILDKKYVFVVNEQNQLEQRRITVAEELPHLYIVSDGITDQDQILLEGLRKVHNGQHIEVDFQYPEKVLASLELHAE